MRRRTFDLLVSGAGLVLAVLLLIAGGLLTWTHSFINDQVIDPALGAEDLLPAGQQPGRRGRGVRPHAPVRRTAADNRCPGSDLRQLLHRQPPQGGCRRQDVLRR